MVEEVSDNCAPNSKTTSAGRKYKEMARCISVVDEQDTIGTVGVVVVVVVVLADVVEDEKAWTTTDEFLFWYKRSASRNKRIEYCDTVILAFFIVKWIEDVFPKIYVSLLSCRCCRFAIYGCELQ